MDFSADQIDALTYGRGMDTSRFAEPTRASCRGSAAGPRWRSSSAAAEPGLLSPERVDGALAAVSRLLRCGTGGARG